MFKNLIFSVIAIVIVSAPDRLSAQNKSGKKLIEFGWDYPNISYLKNNISKMVEAPFDGVVFSFDFDIYNAFDTVQYPLSTFQYDDLSKIQWQSFTDNFLFMRGASYTGAHWLDDQSWLKISRNLKKVSEALKISGAKGIGFDPEYYYNDTTLNPWIYKPAWYNNLSYQEVGNFVRKRGIQFIQALQSDKPDVKILFFWLLDLVDMQSQTKPVSETGMALYPFFIEGILEGKNKMSEIIDGNESSYWFQKPENFIKSGEYLRKRGEKFIAKTLIPKFQNVQLAQAIYFDWIYAKTPQFDKGYDKQTKARWLEYNLYNSFKTSDKYVWFYGERINWWKGQGDTSVARIIRNVRNRISDDRKKSDQISGRSILYDFQSKEPDKYPGGFTYNYTKSTNILEIEPLNNDIKTLRVYDNSRMIDEVKAPSLNFTINLSKKYRIKGNLIIMAEDSKGITSVAYVN